MKQSALSCHDKMMVAAILLGRRSVGRAAMTVVVVSGTIVIGIIIRAVAVRV